MDTAISVQAVSKRFRLQKNRPASIKEKITKRRFERREEFWSLHDVSFDVARGSMFALIGHNDSGKSTLLKVIAGIYRPTGGRVVVDGRISALLELGAGFHPDLSGRENIYLNAAILGMSSRDTDRMIDKIIDFSGIRDFVDTPVRHYSSGMYVRLGFSVAVHVDPQILIVDEVIAVGDEEFQRRCFDHLRHLRQKGTTIVIVTHGMGIVQTMCDEAAWLDHGVLRKVGPAGAVARQYLDEVNSAEVDQREHADHPDGPTTARLIASLDVVDLLGQPLPFVHPADPVVLRVGRAESSEPVRVSVAVMDGRGIEIARSTSPTVRTGSTVDYVIERLNLGPGDYTLAVSLMDASGMAVLERLDGQAELRVRPGDHRVEALVDLQGRWLADALRPDA